MFSRVRSKDSSCGICFRHVESSREVEQGILKDATNRKNKGIALTFFFTRQVLQKCFTLPYSNYHHHTNMQYLNAVLTIVQAKNDCSTKKGTDCLKQEIHGKLPPALPPQQTQSKGDRGIQVATCKHEGILVNIRSRIAWNTGMRGGL